jgi:hypothetical protein
LKYPPNVVTLRDAKDFILAMIKGVWLALPDPDKVDPTSVLTDIAASKPPVAGNTGRSIGRAGYFAAIGTTIILIFAQMATTESRR